MSLFNRSVLWSLWLISSPLIAQQLPPHDPLRILILSDEVNPHGLPDEDLTQPGDLSVALMMTPALVLDAGVDALLEIPTNEIELATSALSRPRSDPLAYDVLIYFSHRIPDNGNQAQARQEAFVLAVDSFLEAGGGVIGFHHGVYQLPGKESMQALLGATATGAVPYDTENGQNVIFVGGSHFIGSHAINHDLLISYQNPDHGVALADYPAFNNTPDERYPQFDYNPGGGSCAVETLFQSDYASGDGTHLLGYTRQCPGWTTPLFVYQPGEYQPNALSGNNLQILLNAIWWLSDGRSALIFSDSFESP